MDITVLKSKIHRACVTGASVNYEGSLAIDPDLMAKVNLHEYEKILVANINNGNRFETYVIRGEQGSKEICLNGAAAKLGKVGDRIIIMSFFHLDESVLKNYSPKKIVLDKDNNIVTE